MATRWLPLRMGRVVPATVILLGRHTTSSPNSDKKKGPHDIPRRSLETWGPPVVFPRDSRVPPGGGGLPRESLGTAGRSQGYPALAGDLQTGWVPPGRLPGSSPGFPHPCSRRAGTPGGLDPRGSAANVLGVPRAPWARAHARRCPKKPLGTWEPSQTSGMPPGPCDRRALAPGTCDPWPACWPWDLHSHPLGVNRVMPRVV